MYNRSELSKAIKQAKASKSKKKPVDVDVDLKGKGYKDPKNSNKPALKLYTDSIYNPTDKDLMLYPDNGLPVFKPAGDVSTTFFPGANNVTERVVAQRGGYVSKQITHFQDGGNTFNFEADKPYTYAGRPGSYYKMVNNQMQIKNKDTDWKYVEMKDPTGTRMKTLQAGLQSGSTKPYQKEKIQSTINDFLYSKDEALNEQVRSRAYQCFQETGQCAASAFLYYDKYVAPNLGLKSSWDLKESAGMSSGPKGKNPKFDLVGESWDSWDLGGGFIDAGGKLHFTSAQNNHQPLTAILDKKTEAEKDDYYRKMKLPVGTIINAGGYDRQTYQTMSGQKGASYNATKGLSPSNHTAIVVGYDEYGTPYIFDEGNIHKITDPNALVNVIGISNIISPKENIDYTYDYLKKNQKLIDKVTPLDLKVPGIGLISDVDEMKPFISSISKNKEQIMNQFNISNSEYDELAKMSAATALTESHGGMDTAVRWWGPVPIPSYATDKLGFGESTGITQINPKSVWNKDEKTNQYRNSSLVKGLSGLGITEKNYDPWNPDHQAIVTMGLMKENLKTAKNNASKNPNVNKNLTDAELAYYQWNIPSALTTDDYDKAARGDNENVKRFMQYYNLINTSNKKLGGNIDPGNNALELHMFYDKDVFQDGGQYLDLTDQEIEEYRKGGYVVEEPVKPKSYEKYKDFRKRNIIDLTLNPGEAAKKYMSVNPELFDAYMYYKNLGYKPSTGSETCSARYCKYDEDAWKQFNKTSTTDRFAPVRSTPVVSKSKTDSKNTTSDWAKTLENDVLKVHGRLPTKYDPLLSTKYGDIEYIDRPAVEAPVDEIYSLPTRSTQTINTERSLPEIPTNEETLIKRWSPEQNKWILNEVSATDPAVKLYQEKVDWAKKNPQRRESSLFISAEEQAEYENKKKRELDILKNFLGNKTNESLTKAQKGGQRPILYVDPNDPAGREKYQAYQDSLSLHNLHKGHIESLQNTPNTASGFDSWTTRVYNPVFWESQELKNRLYNLNNEFPKPENTYQHPSARIAGGWRSAEEYKKPLQQVKYKPNPEIGNLPTKKLPQVETPEIIPSNYNYTPQKPEIIRTASRSQTVMEPDPNRPGKFKYKELRQVPYSAYFPGEGWEDMGTPRVMYYNPETDQEGVERFQNGGQKDSWGRLLNDKYYGFDPKTKKYTIAPYKIEELRKQAAGVSKYDPLYQKAIPSETTQQAAKNLPSQKKSVNEAMAIKTAEKDATIKAVKELPLLTQEQKNEILMDPRKLDEYSYLTRLQEPETLKAAKQYSTMDKIENIVRNPLVAATYAMQPGDFNMPMNYSEFERSPDYNDPLWNRNAVGQAANFARYFTPVGLAASAMDNVIYTADDVKKALKSGKAEDWKQAGYSGLNTALDLVGSRYIGASGRLLNAGERATLEAMNTSNRLGLNPSINRYLGTSVFPNMSSSIVRSADDIVASSLFPQINPMSSRYNSITRKAYNTAVTTGNVQNASQAVSEVLPKFRQLPDAASTTGLTKTDVDNAVNNQINWITSEEYYKRRSANTGETYDQIFADVNKTINNAKDAKVYLNAELPNNIQGQQTPRSLNTMWGPPTIEVSKTTANPPMVLKHEVGHLYSPAGFDVSTSKLHRGFDNPNVGALPANKRGVYANYPNIGGDQMDEYLQFGYEQQVRHLNARDQILKKYNLDREAPLTEEQVYDFVNTWNKKVENRNAGFSDAESNFYFGKEEDYDDIWLSERNIAKQQLKDKYDLNDPKKIAALSKEEKQKLTEETNRLLSKKITDVLNKAWATVPVGAGIGAATYLTNPWNTQEGLQFQDGGSVGMEMDLTDEEIKKYRDAGYVIIE
jgi:hypothetical protein